MSTRVSRRAFLSTVAASAVAEPAETRTNVVLIMADDLGYECLNCNGGTSYKTPHLDALARSGIRFTHAYAQPLCTPTRVQLMTGQHNFRNWVGFGLMNPHEKTFGHMMQKAGYKTAIAGKWQFYSYDGAGSPRRGKGMPPQNGGFDEYALWHAWHTEDKGSRYAEPVIFQEGKLRGDTKGKYGEDLFCEFSINFMERNKDRPFFLYYPMVLTHGPFNATPRSADWTKGNRLKDDPKYYADMVEYMDETVGRVVQKIDDLGLASRTLVLFYSDNGTPREIKSRMGDRIIEGGKGLTLDTGMHVPMIGRWQGVIKPDRVTDRLTDSTDFVPSIMEATGAKWFDQPLDGKSFISELRGKSGGQREALFSHYDPHPGCKQPYEPTRFAWDHRWKLYMNGRLFDWQNDPMEKTSVADSGAEAAGARRRLQGVLDQMARVKAPKFNKFETDGRPAY